MTGTIALLPTIAALLGAGAAAGFASGLFGIGGGFVVVPALVLILPALDTAKDQLTHVAIGTSLATIIFTSIRAVSAHARRGAVDFDVLKGWAPWVVGGTIVGSAIADRLSGHALAIIFGVGVLALSTFFLVPALANRQLATAMPGGAARAGIASGLGVLSSLLGIGGGTIVTMVMTLCGNPIHRAIGTASGMGAIIAVPATIGFIVIGLHEPGRGFGSLGYVNLPATIALIATSLVTAPLGVAAAHGLSPALLRRIFGLYLIFVGVTMIAHH